MNSYGLGLDAGGTKTLAVIADENGHVVGLGTGGPGNRDGVAARLVDRSLREAVAEARQASGNVSPLAVFAGIAGVVTGTDRDLVRDILADTVGPHASIEVDHDCRIALAGGLSGRPGIVVIAGTGASVFGRNADGEEWRANGWGSLFGDEGSSYWLAVEGVRAALRAEDGRGAPTVLLGLILSQLGVTDANDLLARARRGAWLRPDLAALAPLVIHAAESGDDVAHALILRATEELAGSVAAVSRALGFDRAPVEVALVGGLLRSEMVRAGLRSKTVELVPGAVLVEPDLAPVVGAALLAIARIRDVEPAALPRAVIDLLRESGADLVPRP